jgi:hypothetical protein
MSYDGIAYCDCPGFGDTKGFEKDLINCISIGNLLTNARSVKLMMVLSYHSVTTLDERGAGLNTMLKLLSGIFKNENYQVADMDSLQKILLVVNNAPLGNSPSGQNSHEYA